MTTAAPIDPPTATTSRTRRTWDLVLTIILLVGYLLGTALASFTSFFLAFAGDSCGASTVCNYDTIGTGIMVVLIGPWVPVIFVIAASIVLLVRKRLAFWIPLVGGVLTIVIAIVGWSIATSGVQPIGS